MSIIEWPKWLPSCETETKRIQTQPGFRINPVIAGTGFAEIISTDTVSTFEVTFKFNSDQAMAFRAWLLINKINKQSGWVNFPIQLEDGLTKQEVMVEAPFQFTGQQGSVFSYSGILVARELKYNDMEYPECILAMFENNPCDGIETGANLLDIAINISWPKYPDTTTGNLLIPLSGDLSIFEEFV